MSKFGEGIRLGFDQNGEVMRYQARDGHLLLVGPTGTGKTTCFLLAAIIEAMRRFSVIIVEPKGSFAAMLFRLACLLGRAFILNAFEGDMPVSLPPSTSYNAMAILDPTKKGYTIGCERLADLCCDEGTDASNENAAHFKSRARSWIAAVIMEVGESPLYENDRHLGTVRNIITSANGYDFWEFVKNALARGNGYVAQKLAGLGDEGAKESREVTDVLATACRFTDFIGNECIGPSLSMDGFRFASMKEEKTTTFITLPAQHLANPAPAKWFKLMVDCALNELWRGRPGKYPVLLIMDEFSQYGALPSIRKAMNLARGYGLTLWPVVQSLGDLKARELYGDGWETFVSGAAVKIFTAAEDLTTREFVSKLSGLKIVKVPNVSYGTSTPGLGWPPRLQGDSSSTNVSFSEAAVPVLQPHEVGNIPPDEFVMRVRGVHNIIRGKRKPYWECHELDGMYDSDPYES